MNPSFAGKIEILLKMTWYRAHPTPNFLLRKPTCINAYEIYALKHSKLYTVYNLEHFFPEWHHCSSASWKTTAEQRAQCMPGNSGLNHSRTTANQASICPMHSTSHLVPWNASISSPPRMGSVMHNCAALFENTGREHAKRMASTHCEDERSKKWPKKQIPTNAIFRSSYDLASQHTFSMKLFLWV